MSEDTATSLAHLTVLARHAVASGLYPLHSEEQALLILLTGAELKLKPTEALRGMSIVHQRIALSADLVVAIVRAHPSCESWDVVESGVDRCEIHCKRRDQTAVYTHTCVRGSVHSERLKSRNWLRYPAVMLRHQCAMELARRVFPEVVHGLHTPEEIEHHFAQGLETRTHQMPSDPAVLSLTAWRAHLEQKQNCFAVRNAFLKRALSMQQVGTLDPSRDLALQRIAAIMNTDTDGAARWWAAMDRKDAAKRRP